MNKKLSKYSEQGILMASKHKTPSHLAHIVKNELKKRKLLAPPLVVLTELFQTLYFASLKTEESQPINCYIVYINPENPDPKPPERIVKDRWSFIPLGQRVAFSVSSLVKIAKASDPRTSSFAVYHDHNNKLFIWGLLDQGNRYFDYLNFDAESGPERPGLFQASILGIGHLAAYKGYDRIAELNVESIITEAHDVLRYGPIRKHFQPAVTKFMEKVREELGPEYYDDISGWRASFESDWVATLCRILLRMRGFHHGGALLMTPDTIYDGLNIKYNLQYDRLRTALVHRAVHQIQKDVAESEIIDILDDPEAETMPLVLHLDESISSDELNDSNSEIDGAIWFVSLLSRVDGLVLLNFDLEVKAFGVEILGSLAESVVTQGFWQVAKCVI
ncbi:putative sensor domain DACNV-containing protein [Geobacter metallireducens]|nr:hypothetical protein [Geobacter metallireducens]